MNNENKSQEQLELENKTIEMTMAFGGLGMAAMLLVIFFIRKIFRGQSTSDLFAMYFAFMAAMQAYKYKTQKGKINLGLLLCYISIALTSLYSFIAE